MKLGEVYFWRTEKVKGRDDREKYHIYICLSDWEGNTFLFINKSGNDWDLEILNSHPAFSFLPLEKSYIDCGSIVTYTDEELEQYEIELKGRLTLDVAKSLLDKLQTSKVLRRDHKKRVCDSLHQLIQRSEAKAKD